MPTSMMITLKVVTTPTRLEAPDVDRNHTTTRCHSTHSKTLISRPNNTAYNIVRTITPQSERQSPSQVCSPSAISSSPTIPQRRMRASCVTNISSHPRLLPFSQETAPRAGPVHRHCLGTKHSPAARDSRSASVFSALGSHGLHEHTPNQVPSPATA
jgi:hypothetical protein